MKQISFKLNDFSYTINNKLTLIQACLKNKVDVPRFCFHEKLSIAGNCRMCLVEDLKQVKPIASCAINVSGSMFIYTNTLKVKKARESVLEFLLANHPLDCPICDQGGECDLQDQSMVFGSDRGRFYEFKRSVEDKDCGPLIKTIMNRCIHCTRCVRFSNEVAGTNVFGVTGRGSKMEIGFYIENLMRNELSGNIIDLCPVGALTSKPFAFTSRSWELKSYNSIDILDSMHSNIRVDVRGTKIMRILPRVNDNINEEWITDKIRFSYDAFRRQRLYEPMVLINNTFLKVSWRRVFYFLKFFFIKVANTFKYSFLPVKSYLGNYLDLETVYLVKRFSHSLGNNYFNKSIINKFSDTTFYLFNTPLLDLNKSDICLLVDLNLRLQLPILNSKIRQLSIKNNIPVYVLGYFSNFNYYAKHVSCSTKTLLGLVEGTHWLSAKFAKTFSKTPIMVSSSTFFNNKLDFLKNFLLYTNLVNKSWNGLNFVPLNSTEIACSELNFSNTHNQNSALLNYSVDWFYNYESMQKKPGSNFSYKVYQGHHGDSGAMNSNVILPSTSFVEKNSFYVNLLGMVQKTKKILFSVGSSRDDWKVINAFSEVSGLTNLHIKNSFNLISFISKTSPFILYKRSNLVNISNNFISYSKMYFHFVSLNSFLNNFYTSDSITRNSKVMSLCFSRFKLKGYNFSN